jgi:small subunit ribosomal protein S20
MANTKSAIKAIRSSAQKNSINKSRKNRIRTFVRKVVDEIKLGNKENAKQALKNLEPELMRGVTKKVYKLNTASRKLSRLYAAVNKINSPAQ